MSKVPKLEGLTFSSVVSLEKIGFKKILNYLLECKKPFKHIEFNLNQVHTFYDYFDVGSVLSEQKNLSNRIIVEELFITESCYMHSRRVIHLSRIFDIKHLKIITSDLIHDFDDYYNPRSFQRMCEHLMTFETFYGMRFDTTIFPTNNWVKKHYKWLLNNSHLFNKELNDFISEIIKIQERLETFCMGLNTSQSSIHLSLEKNVCFDKNILGIVFKYI